MDVTFPLVLLGGAALLPILLKAIRYDRPIRQFSVREMLLFVSICAAWFSLMSVNPLASSRDRRSYCPYDLVVGFVWMVLAVFYWGRRLRSPLVLHAFGPLFLATSIIACWMADGARINVPESCWQLSVGALMGSFVSLPFAVIILVGLLGGRASEGTKTVINEQPQSPTSRSQPSADG